MALNLPYSPDMTYVALAAALLSDELQPYVSAAGLCHLRITSTDDQGCLIHVAALPHRLHDTASSMSRHVFTVWVDAEQLEYALPWDRTLQNLPTCEVRERLEALLSPSFSLSDTDNTALPACAEPVCPVGAIRQQRQAVTLLPLPELFISCETISETIAEGPKPPFAGSSACRTSWTRLAWLHAALTMVRRQMSHACQAFAKLDILLEKVIATQRSMRQSLVSASAVYIGEGLVGWRLQIALPMTEVLA